MTPAALLLLGLFACGCAVRQEMQVFVVVAPDGFASSGIDAGASAEELSTIVIEGRSANTPPPCASRQTGPTSVSVSVDPLHGASGPVYTVSVAPHDGSPLWITIWGKVAGRDRARRSYLVTPTPHATRVLCVGLAPDDDTCQCGDGSRMITLSDASGVEAAIEACAALIRTDGLEAGLSVPTTCAAFSMASCVRALGPDASAGAACATDGADAGAHDAAAPDAAHDSSAADAGRPRDGGAGG